MLSRLVTLVAGCALLLALGPALATAPAPSPKPDKKDDAKKEEQKKDAARQPADADLNRVPGPAPAAQPAQPGGFDPAQAYRMQQEMTRQMQQRMMGAGMHGAPFFAGYAQVGEGRLGVFAQKPSATLVEQLDLPRGQGVVIERVQPDSPADKAGLKAHDVLLELNGKTVPDDAQALARQVHEIKADTPVDAVVLRKGKRETIKGVKLPEAAAPAPAFAAFNFAQTAPAMPPVPAVPNPNFQPGMPPGARGGVLLTTFRTGDRFTTRYQEGSLVITVTGTVADGKAKLGEIHVQDAGQADDYTSVDKVPERYRDKVKTLVETSEKSGARIEIKSP
jgi:hypothetical protein